MAKSKGKGDDTTATRSIGRKHVMRASNTGSTLVHVTAASYCLREMCIFVFKLAGMLRPDHHMTLVALAKN
jgi:hypothetical protein